MQTLKIVAAITTILLAGAASAASDSDLRMSAQQRQDLAGTYKLDNGQRAHVIDLDQRLYIDIGRTRKELLLVAPNRLASQDGRITMLVAPQDRGNRITLGLPGDHQGAPPTRLASGERHGRGASD